VRQNIVGVAAGWNCSLALGNDGRVYAWGFNGEGVTGVDPSTNVVSLPRVITKASDGTELSDIVSISAGFTFALALTSDGRF
jgi:alpha-tubulin suppressor-like RCC1 family protein